MIKVVFVMFLICSPFSFGMGKSADIREKERVNGLETEYENRSSDKKTYESLIPCDVHVEIAKFLDAIELIRYSKASPVIRECLSSYHGLYFSKLEQIAKYYFEALHSSRNANLETKIRVLIAAIWSFRDDIADNEQYLSKLPYLFGGLTNSLIKKFTNRSTIKSYFDFVLGSSYRMPILNQLSALPYLTEKNRKIIFDLIQHEQEQSQRDYIYFSGPPRYYR